MKNNNKQITTLGPSGTDSESSAKIFKKKFKLNGSIVLQPTFKEAIEYSQRNNTYLLIPAAFNIRDSNGVIIESWADLNFYIEDNNILELFATEIFELKDVCIAKNKYTKKIVLAGSHPATKYYLTNYYPKIKIKYYDSKPTAVKECSEGKVDICIGSVDVVNQYHNLEILKKFKSKMCWTLYKPLGKNK